ncbi:MAG: Asp-tRNA(Asn)/Glu-tRNA(Gln) amidotransferase subunit GatA [Candidatus Saccharibacteria bacterium]
MELYQLTALEIQHKLARGEVKPSEVMDSAAKRIQDVEERVKAFVTLTVDAARDFSSSLDASKSFAGITGIPCGIKDNMCTRGVRTTCSSKILENFVPPYDATVVQKLNDQKAVVVGKLNMDEFAMGSSTEQSGFFPTCNPWDLSRVPGGSSGGAAAAVAAEEVFYALGSDTGGSIRQPASLCGVVGLKPTYGRVSRFGLIAYASSLDQIGPLTRTVADSALVMNTISGYDRFDSTSVDEPVPNYMDYLKPDIKGLKIGVPREYFQQGVDPAVIDKIKDAMKKYEEMGAVLEETSLPHSEYALPAYYIVAPAEASSNLARFDGVKYGLRETQAADIIEMFCGTRARGFGPEVKRRVMLGTYALSSGYYDAYYLKALKARRLIRDDFDKAFAKYDVLLAPTTPSVAFKIGEKLDDPLAMYMSDILTIPVNLAGIPAISIPAGFVDGLPVGLQLMGKPFSEGALLQAAYAFEQATNFHKQRPALEVQHG